MSELPCATKLLLANQEIEQLEACIRDLLEWIRTVDKDNCLLNHPEHRETIERIECNTYNLLSGRF